MVVRIRRSEVDPTNDFLALFSGGTTATVAEPIEADVGSDPVNPSADICRPTKLAALRHHHDHDLLGGVLRFGNVVQNGARSPQDAAPVASAHLCWINVRWQYPH